MSITTKRGDTGQTDLLFGTRVPKTDGRMVALGAVDELNAALGLVRLHASRTDTGKIIARVQQELIAVMGVVAVPTEDYPRYQQAGYADLAPAALARITSEAVEIEAQLPPQKDWVLPGSKGHAGSAYLDFARCVCRRAERDVLALAIDHPIIPPYLNRLSDLLWLLARWEELS